MWVKDGALSVLLAFRCADLYSLVIQNTCLEWTADEEGVYLVASSQSTWSLPQVCGSFIQIMILAS